MTDNRYGDPEEHLEQGDIFAGPIVAPIADFTARIFRAVGGYHGSKVFEEGVDAEIVDPEELRTALAAIPSRHPLQTDPFQSLPDRQEEMVVVYARQLPHFIVASQTCDICGLDKDANPHAVIIPILSLQSICCTEILEFRIGTRTELLTVEQCLFKYAGVSEISKSASDYGDRIRVVVKSWAARETRKELKSVSGSIKTFINQYHKPGYLFPLTAEPNRIIPESCVDFTQIYTIPTILLNERKDSRIARVLPPYRDDFAHALGHFLSRISVPSPMRPPPA